MSNNPSQRGGANDFDQRVGQAWSKHFRGDNDSAVGDFRNLLAEWEGHIDANCGMALCLRALGRKDEAREAYRKARQAVENDVKNASDDRLVRYQMILRMIDQQLAVLG